VQGNRLNATMGRFTNKKMAARLSRPIAVEQRKYTNRLGGGHPGLTDSNLLN